MLGYTTKVIHQVEKFPSRMSGSGLRTVLSQGSLEVEMSPAWRLPRRPTLRPTTNRVLASPVGGNFTIMSRFFFVLF